MCVWLCLCVVCDSSLFGFQPVLCDGTPRDQSCVCIFQDLRTPKTGSGTDGGEDTAATWQYFMNMHEVLGGRPYMDPPLLVASFSPDLEGKSLKVTF